MKIILTVIAGLTAGLLFSGCAKDTVTEHYTFYRPVYASTASVKANMKSQPAQAVQYPGKLVVKGNYVFLAELGKGIHIIDYSDVHNPRNLSFIPIPGNNDIAVRGDYMYADCYSDLVVLNVSQPENVLLNRFISNVFPYSNFTLVYDSAQIVTAWQQIDTVVTHSISSHFDQTLAGTVTTSFPIGNSFQYFTTASSSSGGTTNSTAGSMARFALMDNYMYTVGTTYMNLFNTTDASSPSFLKKIYIGENIETVFPFKDNLFIGSTGGLSIYSVANRDTAVLLSTYGHIQSCDPVITDGTYAYVTLYAGAKCGGTANQMDVVDVSRLTGLSLIKSYPFTQPKGLSKDGNLILLCDSGDGVKILDASDPNDIKVIKRIGGIDAYDIIAGDGIALVSATDGLYCIDYHTPSAATIVSKLAI